MSCSPSPPMSSLSTYHQTLSNHISTILSQLPTPAPAPEQHSSSASTADAASATIPAVPSVHERDQEFQRAWEAEGHARHATLPEDFNLQLANAVVAGPSRSRTGEMPTPGREVPESASSQRDRHQRRVERSKRRIEMWRARMDATCLASPSIPPTPMATQSSFFPSPHKHHHSDPLSKLPVPLPVPSQPSGVAVFAPKPLTPHCIPRRTVDPERIALERQINKRLAAAGGLPSPATSERDVLDSLAHCLGLVADLGKVSTPSDASHRMSRRRTRDQPRLQLL